MLLKLVRVITLLFFIFPGTVRLAYAEDCSSALKHIIKSKNSSRLGPRVFDRYKGSQPFRRVKHLRVASMNTYERLKKITDHKFHKQVRHHLEKMSDFILENDVVVLQEVDAFESLKLFNELYLFDNYRIFFLQSNDTNQSHMAYLVRKEIPVDIEMQSHKFYKKNYQSNIVSIFSRDLPILMFRKPGESRSDKPFLAFAGVHYKSMGHSKNDDFSIKKRSLQVEATKEIIQNEVREKFGNIPMIVMGDFNSEVSSKEFDSLKRIGFEDSLDTVNFPSDRRITHNYFSNSGQVERRQMDAILVSLHRKLRVIKSEIYYYKNYYGFDEPLPRDIDDRNKLPSDHNPVWAEILID